MARSTSWELLDGSTVTAKYTFCCYITLFNHRAELVNYPEGCVVFTAAERWAEAHPDENNFPDSAAALFHGDMLDMMPVNLCGWQDPVMAFSPKFGESAGEVHVAEVPKQEFPKTGGYSLHYDKYHMAH